MPSEANGGLEGRMSVEELERAFSLFTEASRQLADSYEDLRLRVQKLTDELAVANGQLRQQYAEKAALSQRLQTLLEALPAGVVELNGKGKVLAVNRAAEKMLGSGVLGLSWSEFESDCLRLANSPNEYELKRSDAHFERQRVTLANSDLPDGAGKIVLLHDVTQSHALQVQLEHHKRLSAMGEMAAALAHQLRTPLATALLYCANITRPGLSPEDIQRFAQKSVARLRHLEKLVQDMLRFVRGQGAGAFERVGVKALLGDVHQTIEPQMIQAALTLQFEDFSGDCELMADRQAIHAALMSLLENAVQAAKPGGLIVLRAYIEDELLNISVKDDGCGISEEVLARMFEPFFTTRNAGTGLGLAIVRNVMDAHGGTVVVHSCPDAGSEFILRLPVDR